MAQLINGKEIAAALRGEIAAETAALKAQGITPGLAVILVGDDPASQTYAQSPSTSSWHEMATISLPWVHSSSWWAPCSLHPPT